MNRRTLLQQLTTGAALSATGLAPVQEALAQQPKPRSLNGLPPLTITDVKTILTSPNGIRLVVVKIETSEPGLYGLGCATFTQRAYVVHTAIEKYLKPFLIGRNADEIEDIWQSSYVSSYWRNGPVLFNAMSGVDMALWDIKAKRANMPLYQLLGGKCRAGADLYFHAQGSSPEEVEDSARSAMERGYRHVRVQMGLKGNAVYGAKGPTGTPASSVGTSGTQAGLATPAVTVPGPTNPKLIFDPNAYVKSVPKLFEHLRVKLGDEVELLHDIHERVSLSQAVQVCKAVEPYRPFFIEDPFPPEDNDHFKLLRQQTTVPLAMGELFNTQHEYVPLIKDRLIDFIRIHISQIGGLSPARKVQAMCEFFGVKTAWHGPGDASPVAHASQLALELTSYNFGIHEGYVFPENTQEVFPGCPTVKDGYMYAQEKPGHGVDINEKVAAKFPFPDGPTFDYSWGATRKKDGTVIRP
ncbi:Starvation-sensing protein rspA [Fibrisoma limi BUZ 3]|uniref:Starvation-sensing protein rspA n=1 Tax=Fibrisoma limi BUZ 3 TaxID=1185876 RepID=I2GMS3_9BACT|nr:enolase C-terminal domain-like protein [Fibrisoma limi]CCH55201.1 Starvation-sensing protein rspA [Fibrisoma limi BUZ 3]